MAMSVGEAGQFALAVGVIVIVAVLALATDRAANRWRIVGAGLALLGALSLAVYAVNGPGPELTRRFSPDVVFGMRLLSGAGALWATYLAVDQIRIWWRRGDRDDD